MVRKFELPVAAGLAIACLVLGSCGAQSCPRAGQHQEIEASGRAQPGRLGFPLGTSLRISGIRAEEGKVGKNTLLVDSINSDAVAEPVAIWIDNTPGSGLPSGTPCTFDGYEDGRVVGCEPGGQAVHQFVKYFVITEVIEPKSLHAEKGR